MKKITENFRRSKSQSYDYGEMIKDQSSVGQKHNVKLYIEQHKFIRYDENEHVQNTFMSWWTLIFRFAQVFYLLGVMIAIIFYSFVIFFNKIEIDGAELYEEYVKQYKEANPDENDKPAYSQNEIVFASILLKCIVVAALPVTYLIYLSRLTTLHAFVILKLHEGGRSGVAYNKCFQFLDKLFCLTRLSRLDYIEFINFRNKMRGRREVWAETAQFVVLTAWLGMNIYYSDFKEFFIVADYLALLLFLSLQKLALFFAKILVFGPVYLIYKVYMLTCAKRCAEDRSDRDV